MRRVRVQGDLYHGRVPEGAVYVGRKTPNLPASPFANPFTLKQHGEAALRLYEEHLDRHPDLLARARRELAGKDLACWCKLGQPCHADILLRRIGAAEAKWSCWCGWSGPESALASDYNGTLEVPGGSVHCATVCPSCGEWLESQDPKRESYHGC